MENETKVHILRKLWKGTEVSILPKIIIEELKIVKHSYWEGEGVSELRSHPSEWEGSSQNVCLFDK